VSSKTKDRTPNVTLDQFDVPHWRPGANPFEQQMRRLAEIIEEIEKGHDKEAAERLNELHSSASVLHGNLLHARAIALSIFGPEWPDHVMDVYDRLMDADPDGPLVSPELIEEPGDTTLRAPPPLDPPPNPLAEPT